MTNNRKVVRQETGGTPGKYNKKSLNLSVVPTGTDAFTTLKLRSFVITLEMFAKASHFIRSNQINSQNNKL